MAGDILMPFSKTLTIYQILSSLYSVKGNIFVPVTPIINNISNVVIDFKIILGPLSCDLEDISIQKYTVENVTKHFLREILYNEFGAHANGGFKKIFLNTTDIGARAMGNENDWHDSGFLKSRMIRRRTSHIMLVILYYSAIVYFRNGQAGPNKTKIESVIENGIHQSKDGLIDSILSAGIQNNETLCLDVFVYKKDGMSLGFENSSYDSHKANKVDYHPSQVPSYNNITTLPNIFQESYIPTQSPLPNEVDYHPSQVPSYNNITMLPNIFEESYIHTQSPSHNNTSTISISLPPSSFSMSYPNLKEIGPTHVESQFKSKCDSIFVSSNSYKVILSLIIIFSIVLILMTIIPFYFEIIYLSPTRKMETDDQPDLNESEDEPNISQKICIPERADFFLLSSSSLKCFDASDDEKDLIIDNSRVDVSSEENFKLQRLKSKCGNYEKERRLETDSVSELFKKYTSNKKTSFDSSDIKAKENDLCLLGDGIENSDDESERSSGLLSSMKSSSRLSIKWNDGSLIHIKSGKTSSQISSSVTEASSKLKQFLRKLQMKGSISTKIEANKNQLAMQDGMEEEKCNWFKFLLKDDSFSDLDIMDSKVSENKVQSGFTSTSSLAGQNNIGINSITSTKSTQEWYEIMSPLPYQWDPNDEEEQSPTQEPLGNKKYPYISTLSIDDNLTSSTQTIIPTNDLSFTKALSEPPQFIIGRPPLIAKITRKQSQRSHISSSDYNSITASFRRAQREEEEDFILRDRSAHGHPELLSTPNKEEIEDDLLKRVFKVRKIHQNVE